MDELGRRHWTLQQLADKLWDINVSRSDKYLAGLCDGTHPPFDEDVEELAKVLSILPNELLGEPDPMVAALWREFERQWPGFKDISVSRAEAWEVVKRDFGARNLPRHKQKEGVSWALEGLRPKQRSSAIGECPRCGALIYSTTLKCSKCGLMYGPEG